MQFSVVRCSAVDNASFRKVESRKTDGYDRLCLDLEEAGLQAINKALEVGARGFINQGNMAVLPTLSSMCKVRDFKEFARTLGKISLFLSKARQLN